MRKINKQHSVNIKPTKFPETILTLQMTIKLSQKLPTPLQKKELDFDEFEKHQG